MKEFDIKEAKEKAAELRKHSTNIIRYILTGRIISHASRNNRSFTYIHDLDIYPEADMQAVIDYFNDKNIFIKHIKKGPLSHELGNKYSVDISAMFDQGEV